MYSLIDQPVGNALTLDQVERAIKVGATTAGWRIQDADAGHLIGTLNIRSHTVIVDIRFTHNSYGITYKNSLEMKIYCTEEEKASRQRDSKPPKVTGRDVCPGNAVPMYIHGAYRDWIDKLNLQIQGELVRAAPSKTTAREFLRGSDQIAGHSGYWPRVLEM